ncbi:MAG: hypothetical protein NWS18_00420 [Schleiferiaceae bacterium]|jgi:hypothetical protein|nr:hypothetical protein [Schleiferiaceae bacterium]MDP4627891.1 hypothetical protein [Schleiferiaceae bacterium]MDP4749109.1 hypothetical protein [Schleiferiaceae bacterium]MDP4860116.1 hypothetical protein [Schleiferiaceae bacterium]
MKIKYLNFILLVCLTPNSVWAQSYESAMQFESYFADWGITYKGKPYSGISKTPGAIAKECNCDEAVLLFKESRKQYINSLITLSVTLPIGLIGGTFGGVYSGTVLESPALAIISVVGGAAVGSSGIWVIRKSNLKGRSAVFEFNRCIESKSAK